MSLQHPWFPAVGVIVGMILFSATGRLTAGGTTGVPFERLTASEEQGGKYGADKAADGLAETHWAARNAPPVWIQAAFAGPRWISRIRCRQCEQTSIYDNWRRISISFSDGSGFSCTLGDRWQEQTICFPRRKASGFRITVESTYKTSHYVGIGEVAAEDEGEKAAVRSAVSVEPPVAVSEAPPAVEVAQAGGVLPIKGKAPATGATEEDTKLIARLAPASTSPSSHPTLFMNAADVERAKENIRGHEWVRRVFKGILDGADRWLAMSDEQLRGLMPKKGALFDNKSPCPVCGGACTASLEAPGKVSCTGCKRAFPDAEHPDDGSGWKNPKTAEITYFVGHYNSIAVDRVTDGVEDLSHAYILTRDERYAHALTVLLDALAVIYPSCDKGPVWYPGVGGRLDRPFYQTARTLIYYAREYDLTCDSPEWDKPSCDPTAGTRRANYTKNLLMNGAEYCFSEVVSQKRPGLHNGNCDYLQGALAVGRVLGVQKFIDYNLESDLSIFNFIENTIDRDGQYFETSFGYSHWATSLFGHHAEMLRNYRSAKYPNGISLYELPKLRMNYLRADSDIDCAGHMPALGDAGPDLMVTDEGKRGPFSPVVYERLEILTARTADPERKRELQGRLYEYCGGDVEKARGENATRWLLFNAEDVPVPAKETVGSEAAPQNTLLAGGRGVAILRSGRSEAGQRCALLRYGATLNHGSPDEMNINLYAFGREITYDPGYGWAHHRAGWAHATVAHNLVAVNEKNQLLDGDGAGGSLEHFCESPSVRVVSADDPAAYGGEGVKRYRRLLAVVDLSPDSSYMLDVFDVKGGRQHDLSHHFCGELAGVDGLTLGAPQATGSLAGPEYEWWKFIQPSGWIAGYQKKPFYWNPPPENGYGFLYDVQKAALESSAPRFTWKLGERETRPTHVFSPAACVSGTAGGEARQLNLGCFFFRSEKPGDFITFRAPVEAAGDYLVLVKFYKSTHYGTVSLKVDGKPLGEAVNTYSPIGYFGDLVSFGRVHLDAGVHELRFECAGKDPESAGYYFSMKYFALEPPDFIDKVAQKQTEGARLTVMPPRDSTMAVAKAKGLANAPVSSYVLARRSGQELESRFVSVIEPFVGEARTAGLAEPAKGVVKVDSANGRRDYFFDSPDGPREGKATFEDGGVPVRFEGRFGAALTRAGKPFEALLAGAKVLSVGGLTVSGETAGYVGKVTAVDYEKGLVTVDAALSSSIGANGYLVYFSGDTYSRSAPYFIGGVRAAQGGSQIDVGGASLMLAHGRVSSDISKDGVFSNAVPLDRERAFGRKTRTRYFDGKAIRNTRTGEIGRIKNANLDASIVVDVNPGLRSGDRFDLLDVQVGDTFTVPAIVTLTQVDKDEWAVRSNVKVDVALPEGKWQFDPGDGKAEWRFKVTAHKD